MNTIQQALAAIAHGATAHDVRRDFGDMMLLGLRSKGYATDAERLRLTDAGLRALADKELA